MRSPCGTRRAFGQGLSGRSTSLLSMTRTAGRCWPNTTMRALPSGFGISRRISALPTLSAISGIHLGTSLAGYAVSTVPVAIPIGQSEAPRIPTAQTRLTYIAGIRDDLLPSEYEEPPTVDIADALLEALCQETEPHSFREAANFAADDLGQDLRWELERLRSAGVTRVVAIDLTRPDFGIPVVRVVIPGLEGDIRHPHYVPGPRARRAAAPSR